jgi:DNA-binding transcriptional regulator YhcF (GntR family)
MGSPPVLRIDLASPIPAYRQIANAVRAMLVSGLFKPGDQLPTVRQLAIDLGVHHNTIAEAYRLLSDEGWLDMRRRHGVTVRDREQPAPSPKTHESFSRRLHELIAEASAEGLSTKTIVDGLRALAEQLLGGPPVKE